MVAEGRAAAGPLAEEARAAGAAGGHDDEVAVGRRTPARVRIGGQHAPQHKVLVLLQQRLVVKDRPDVCAVVAIFIAKKQTNKQTKQAKQSANQARAPFQNQNLSICQCCNDKRLSPDDELFPKIISNVK